jgi:DNA invertase Pin-like site-specific DNA recombinase
MHGALFTADGGEVLRDDPDDPMRTAMRQMAGVFAQLDRGLITKRLRDGRRVKAEGGGYAGGRPPLGKRAVGGELVDDVEEQRTVARIRALRADGCSLRAIAETLTAEGYTPRRSERWHAQSIKRIVDRL